jgi:hypothetical protein
MDEPRFVKFTRPGQAWCSLIAAFVYIFTADQIELGVLGFLFALPLGYAGLRQIGKNIEARKIT